MKSSTPFFFRVLMSGSRRLRDSRERERERERSDGRSDSQTQTQTGLGPPPAPPPSFVFQFWTIWPSLWLCKSPRLASLATKTNRLVNSHHSSSYCLCDTNTRRAIRPISFANYAKYCWFSAVHLDRDALLVDGAERQRADLSEKASASEVGRQ